MPVALVRGAVSSGGGGSVTGVLSSFYLKDSSGGIWKVSVNASGNLVTTGVNAIPAGSLYRTQFVTQDASFNYWTVTVDTSGHLITTPGGNSFQSIIDILINDINGITWILTVDDTGHLVTA